MSLEKEQSSKVAIDLQKYAQRFQVAINSDRFAVEMDRMDPLAEFRSRFTFPTMKTLPCTDPLLVNGDDECVYLCGNSLGLKPKKADVYMKNVFDCWGNMGVFTHFNGLFPVALCDLTVKEHLAHLVGASNTDQVVCMNGLSVNIHLLLTSFYEPRPDRYKIIIEEKAFPSDRYAVVSQLVRHGHSEEDGLIVLKSRPGEHTLRDQDILATIRQQGHQVAIIFLSGIHFYTGQKFDIESITKAGHDQGCLVGWDLAHAAGNVELKLVDWDVDFACWCSYKYLNSGAGGIGAAFVNECHHERIKSTSLKGWWGNRSETRFEMIHNMDSADGADTLRLCNPPPFLVALNKAGLEIFEEATIQRLLTKQHLLTGYLEYLLDEINDSAGGNLIDIITPRDPARRGSQLSLIFSISLEDIHSRLEKRGVVCDIRLPSVMRLAPVPTYNSFCDVYLFCQILKQELNNYNIQKSK